MAPVKIMIVEDEVLIGMGLKSDLEGLGYTVTSVLKYGEQALERAERDRPDAIIMDVRLAGPMDGIEAARAIKSSLQIPVILLSALTEEPQLERAKLAEPFGFIPKPYRKWDLRAAIEMALFKAGMEEELRRRTHDLGERIKELNCLYGISSLTERPGVTLEEIYQGVADLITPAWQYPELACARVVMDGREYRTSRFRETSWKQAEEVRVY
ncbi:MAG: response regulator, partial [Thermodesulfobacteriota bacterium]